MVGWYGGRYGREGLLGGEIGVVVVCFSGAERFCDCVFEL